MFVSLFAIDSEDFVVPLFLNQNQFFMMSQAAVW